MREQRIDLANKSVLMQRVELSKKMLWTTEMMSKSNRTVQIKTTYFYWENREMVKAANA